MIKSERLDGIVAIAYPQAHYEIIRAAAEANIPMLVEKPPVETLRQLEDIIQHRRKNGSPVLVGLNFGFSEAFIRLRKIVEGQKIGDILGVTIVHYADKPKDSLWGLDRVRSTLLAQAIHPLGLLLELGSIIGLKSSDIIEKDTGLFMNLAIDLLSHQGCRFTANIITGSSSPYFNWNMSVYGSSGIASIDSLNELHVKSSKDDKWWGEVWHGSPLMSGARKSGFKQELEVFIDIISNRSVTCFNTLDNLLGVYAIIEKLEQEYAGK